MLVGGPAVGGAGRTAVVAHLAGLLSARGERVAVLGHGYGGSGLGLRPVTADVARDGDEAVALRLALPPEVGVWVGPRTEGIAALARPDAVLLVDGGLLDAKAPASAVIAVVDASASTRVLPAGPLRCDLATAVSAAHCLWWHRVDQPEARVQPALAPLDQQLQSVVVPRAVIAPDGARLPVGWLRARNVAALAAIARPEAFVHTLQAAGAQVVHRHFLCDHSDFSGEDLLGAPAGVPWVTPTKNAVRPAVRGHAHVLETGLQVQGDLQAALWRWLR